MPSELEYPESHHDKSCAAIDPLTPEMVLRKLYVEPEKEFWDALVRNPSLPLDLLNDMFSRRDQYLATRLTNSPHFSIEQIKLIVSTAMGTPEDLLNKYKSVLEIFDYLISVSSSDDELFVVSILLQHPDVSAEEYMDRIYLHFFELERHNSVFSDARFDPNTMDLSYSANINRAIVLNPSASAETLITLTGPLTPDYFMQGNAVANLNYPIGLSAPYHIKMFEYYKWKPTYLLALEGVVHAWLDQALGEGPWEDLPLLWKLKIIAG